MNGWITVPYPHEPHNTEPLWLGVSPRGREQPTQWHDAYRDVRNGQRVLTAPIQAVGTIAVWVRDSAGPRLVKVLRL